MRASGCEVLMSERSPAQGQLRANVLSQRATFTALPGLKLTAADELRCLFVLAGLTVKGAKLDAQVIALLHEVKPFGKFAQSPLRFLAKALPKLIALEKETGVLGVGAKRAIVGRPGFGGLLSDIEIPNAEIAPGGGEIAVEFRAALPKANSFLVTATVVK